MSTAAVDYLDPKELERLRKELSGENRFAEAMSAATETIQGAAEQIVAPVRDMTGGISQFILGWLLCLATVLIITHFN